MPDHDMGTYPDDMEGKKFRQSSFFPTKSPWSQTKPVTIPDKPDTRNLPVGRVASDRDLEDAHHLLRSVINNFDPEKPYSKRDAENLARDLFDIENLIYRSLR